MATIHVYQYFTVNIDARTLSGGSRIVSREISISDNEVSDQTFKVPPTTAVKIWDKTENEAMGDFDFLYLESDLDVLVQFTTDAGGTDDYDVKELKGSGTSGRMGPALILGSDDTQLTDGNIDWGGGSPTAGTIDEIFVYNESASDTARVRRFVAT